MTCVCGNLFRRLTLNGWVCCCMWSQVRNNRGEEQGNNETDVLAASKRDEHTSGSSGAIVVHKAGLDWSDQSFV